jgi:hypothetical protein
MDVVGAKVFIKKGGKKKERKEKRELSTVYWLTYVRNE